MSLLVTVQDVGGSTLCEAWVDPSRTIFELKEAIESRTGIPQCEQRLCDDLVELADGDSVRDRLGPDSDAWFETQAPKTATVVMVRESKDWAAWFRTIKDNGLALGQAPKEFRSDRRLVMAAARHNFRALSQATQDVLADHDFLLDAVQEDPRIANFVVSELVRDRRLVCACLQLVRAMSPGEAVALAGQAAATYPELEVDAGLRPPDEDCSGEPRKAPGSDDNADDADDASAFFSGVGAGASMGAAGLWAMSGSTALVGAIVEEGLTALSGTMAALMGGTAAAMVSAAVLPVAGGLAVNRFVPGIPASDVQVRLAKAPGTCPVREAQVVWLAEEGWGEVRLYYFPGTFEALLHTEAWSCSRILFDFSGFISRTRPLSELRCEGPAWPRSTIRKAAALMNSFCRAP